jgi:hypothetical protein
MMGRLSDVANGLYGVAPAPYGWVNVGKTIRHHHTEWPVVQKIIELRFERGLTIVEIAEVLNRGGKRTRMGKRWGYYSVRSVLSKMHIHDEKAYHMGRHMEPTLVVKLQDKEKKDD